MMEVVVKDHPGEQHNVSHLGPQRPPALPSNLSIFKTTMVPSREVQKTEEQQMHSAAVAVCSKPDLATEEMQMQPVQQQQQRPPPQVIIIHTVDYDNPSLMQNSSSMEDEEDGGEKQQQQRQAFSMPLPETESLTATVSGGAGGGEDAAQQHPEKKIHHLTRHWLAPESRGTSAIDALGAGSAKAAENMIRSMNQRELRAAFLKVYGSTTNSYNNNWLRRKLFEAVGVSGGAAKKIKRLSRETSARQQQHRRSAAAAAAEAEAVEALAEIASGPGITGSAAAESSSDN